MGAVLMTICPAVVGPTVCRAVLCRAVQAVGEPPFHLGAAVFFALKDAVYVARADAGLTGAHWRGRWVACEGGPRP